jgi:hypothetical protein
MEEIAERLKVDGYDVVDTALIPMACNLDLAKKPQLNSDILVVYACDSGVYTFATFYPQKKLLLHLTPTMLAPEIDKETSF